MPCELQNTFQLPLNPTGYTHHDGIKWSTQLNKIGFPSLLGSSLAVCHKFFKNSSCIHLAPALKAHCLKLCLHSVLHWLAFL